MEHNTNQNSNYLALLNLTDDGTYTVTKIEIIGSDKFVYIKKNLKPTLCPMCQSRMHSKGIYVRKVNHPISQDSMNTYLIVRRADGCVRSADSQRMIPFRFWINTHILQISRHI